MNQSRPQDAVVFTLNLIGGPDQPTYVLHGDTLIGGNFSGLDEIGVAASEEAYWWGAVRLQGRQLVGPETVAAGMPTSEQRMVACGYFSFKHSTALVRGIVRVREDFLQGNLSQGRQHSISVAEVDSWLDFWTHANFLPLAPPTRQRTSI